MIVFSEYVEKSVNKKQYAITEKGREELIKWLQKPANINAAKNMELGKFLFMGMLPKEKQIPLIEEVIKQLKKDLEYLLEIQKGITQDHKNAIIEFWKSDYDYYSDVIEKAASISKFEELALQHGIDSMKFNIEWFKKLIDGGQIL